MHESIMNAQSTYHRYGLASLIRELYAHSLLNPESSRGHPQVKRRLIYVNDVVLRLLHEDLRDCLGELLLRMLKLHLPGCLGAVHDLRLSIRGAVLQVELPDGPCRELVKLEFLSPIRRSLLQ